jgi:hypothetical protein
VNCRVCGTELPTGAIFCGECGSSVTATPVRQRVIADPRPSDTTIVEPLPFEQAPSTVEAPAAEPVAEPVAREADAAPAAEPVSFTFRLSSGGVETVVGSGLLGRRPAPQPGEEVEVLIAFVDPGLSVSKTHLEFGIEGDNLWICDRYSANGTVLRAPGGIARLCEPGRRYRVTRESRIEIGEQYFDVG